MDFKKTLDIPAQFNGVTTRHFGDDDRSILFALQNPFDAISYAS